MLIVFNSIVPIYASNLGVIGQTYLIQEEDFLSFIEHRVLFMQKNGEWQRIQKEAQERVRQHVDRPTPLKTLIKTIQPRTWDYDPSVIFPYDLHDDKGKVFVKAGTRINPLTIISLHTALAFYDADDKNQVNWANKINKKYSGKIKLVLVNGSVSSQESLFHQPIYFDQEGRLTSRFNIRQVPALVYQDGIHLKIAEVLP